MIFKNYKHIELLEEITIPKNRVKDNKIVNVKNWDPKNPFRLRVKATVRKEGKRTIKKRTYVYEGINMVKALDHAEKELDKLLQAIRDEDAVQPEQDDRDKMMTFKEAYFRSVESRKLAAEAEGEEFRTYNYSKSFYENHLTSLADKPLDKISTDMLNHLRAGMKHKVGPKKGQPLAKKTKLSVLLYVSPAYTWFNDYSNLTVKNPARIPKGAIKKLGNERKVQVEDIKPLFQAMANYTFTVFGKEHTDPYRSIFIWLMHGRRVNEVLSLDWKDVNLKNGTYTITAANNKAKIDMTYKLTPYQLETLKEPKRKGLVFPPRKGGAKPIGPDVLWTHFKRVRESMGEWTLNNKTVGPEEFHIHDIRHLIATEMLNKYYVVDEISGAALGHTRSGITARYAEIMMHSVNDAVMKVLDGVLR